MPRQSTTVPKVSNSTALIGVAGAKFEEICAREGVKMKSTTIETITLLNMFFPKQSIGIGVIINSKEGRRKLFF